MDYSHACQKSQMWSQEVSGFFKCFVLIIIIRHYYYLIKYATLTIISIFRLPAPWGPEARRLKQQNTIFIIKHHKKKLNSNLICMENNTRPIPFYSIKIYFSWTKCPCSCILQQPLSIHSFPLLSVKKTSIFYCKGQLNPQS